MIVILGAFGIGCLLGGLSSHHREVLALGTGQRNIAAASVVASQALGDADVLVWSWLRP